MYRVQSHRKQIVLTAKLAKDIREGREDNPYDSQYEGRSV
jgi:hypothetical protein